jgi:beta-N-acetylhexosaminidase
MRAVAAACLALVLAGGAPARETATPTLAQLVGQKLVVSMNGTTPSASLLRRVRRGDVGGVIVHRFNFGSSAQLRRITRTLQRAAVAAGRPKLLMAVDQEGGRVKTVLWAPPTLPPARIGARAGEQGRRTGAALRALGVNVDLAPVADLPASRASAVYRQGRTWSFDAQETARRAAAFARGLRGGRVVATTKLSPDWGSPAATPTARSCESPRPSAGWPGPVPFRRAFRDRVPVPGRRASPTGPTTSATSR